MKKINKKVVKYWNITADSERYMDERTDEVITSILNNPESVFHKTTWKVINSVVPVIQGKKICVPSSGCNKAVFAFAALGAQVTSCDISERQLVNASSIANKFDLNIEFKLQNTMELSDIKSSQYDFVFTSEGVHVWIDDLYAMYNNIYRILKDHGVYINYEIHPFSRPFKDNYGKISIVKPYDSTGPFDNGMTYHWRIQDLVNAIASSGLTIKHLEELYDEKYKGHFWFYNDKRKSMSSEEIDGYYNWETNPLAALPQWFTLCATKK